MERCEHVDVRAIQTMIGYPAGHIGIRRGKILVN